LLLFASTWVGSVLSMLTSLLVARALGPAAMGSVGFSLGLSGLVMAALLPGFGQAHLKRLAEGYDAGRCFGTMATIQLALTGVLAVAVAVVLGVHGGFESRELTVVFGFMLAAQVVANFAEVAFRVFLARELVIPHGLIIVGGRLVRLVLTLAILVAVPRITWVAATFTLEALLNLIIATALLVGRYGVRPAAPTRQSLRDYWSYARPFLVTTPLALFQDSVDRYVVGRWAGLAAAGYYHVARALWEALSSVLAPPGTFLFTRLSRLYAKRSAAGDREAETFFNGWLDKVLFMTVPVAFGFWALAEPLIGLLYGASFHPAATTLRILVLATLAASVINAYTLILYALDQAHRFIVLNVVRVVVYLAALWALVPARPALDAILGLRAGDPGAALARLILMLFPAWVYWRWTRELGGIGFYRPAWTYMVGFALMLGVHHGVIWSLTGGVDAGPMVTLPVMAAALCVYLGFLLAVHPETRHNLGYVASILSPARFRTFLREGA
jgi:O-antigen/teichoic acid export membrane protein